jgi:DNA-directed RNA polymerase specialized sigma24 family protein
MGYSISFSGEGVYFSTTDVRDVPELAEGMSPFQRTIGFLRANGGSTAKEIADGIALSVRSVQAILRGGRGRVFCMRGDGDAALWALLTDREDDVAYP